jgi:UDP-4-amino-4,6-dideoxy-N-acetyl-beta-L-altrosamine N-acetyltransferase
MIKLRDVQPEDREQILIWRNMPDVASYMYNDHQITSAEHAIWFQSAMSDPSKQYWIIRFEETDVGLVNLYNIDRNQRRCYWAFYIADPNMRGKGIGPFVEATILRYVFDDLQFNKLCCEVLATNDSVVQLHKSFGFEQEGYYRQHILKRGVFVDVVALAILRSEWEKRIAQIEERLQRIEKRNREKR